MRIEVFEGVMIFSGVNLMFFWFGGRFGRYGESAGLCRWKWLISGDGKREKLEMIFFSALSDDCFAMKDGYFIEVKYCEVEVH